MKKFLTLLLVAFCMLLPFSLTACSEDKSAIDEITIYAPEGAPSIGIAKFIADKENFGTGVTVRYTVISANDIQAIVGKGDIIVMPVNLATKIYNTGKTTYKMAGVLTHGNLYVIAKNEITLDDLKGQVVGVANLSNVPGLTFKSVLNKNGVQFEMQDTPVEGKVALKDYTGAELMAALKTGVMSVGVLPEPIATKLVTDDTSFKIALDLQELYDGATKSYPQAVVMVKTSVIEKYPELIAQFAQKVAGSVQWVKENPAQAVAAIASVLAEGVTQSINANNLNAQVVDNCNVYWQSAQDAKAAVNAYIADIRQILAASANEVDDSFFA